MPADSRPASLSIVMPVHNEGATLRQVLERLGKTVMPVPWELIIVDDGSTDGAVDAVQRDWVPDAERVVVLRARRNRGKGSALRRGFAECRGDILGVQDADLEYDPAQIPALVEPIVDGRADAVLGTREFGAHTAYSYWYVVGNRLISTVASVLFNRYITDAYTCYKFFTRDCYSKLDLTADGFEIEAELVGGLLRAGAHVHEIPINYAARTRQEGKKIRASDGLRAVLRLLRVRTRGR